MAPGRRPKGKSLSIASNFQVHLSSTCQMSCWCTSFLQCRICGAIRSIWHQCPISSSPGQLRVSGLSNGIGLVVIDFKAQVPWPKVTLLKVGELQKKDNNYVAFHEGSSRCPSLVSCVCLQLCQQNSSTPWPRKWVNPLELPSLVEALKWSHFGCFQCFSWLRRPLNRPWELYPVIHPVIRSSQPFFGWGPRNR